MLQVPPKNIKVMSRNQKLFAILCLICLPISGQVDGAFAAEAVDSGSIPGRFKPKTTSIKIGIHTFSV